MSRSVAHVEVGCRLYRLTGESMRRHKIKRPRQRVGSRSNCPRLRNGLICFSILLSGRELQCAFAACDLVAKAIDSGFAISQRRRTNCCKRWKRTRTRSSRRIITRWPTKKRFFSTQIASNLVIYQYLAMDLHWVRLESFSYSPTYEGRRDDFH